MEINENNLKDVEVYPNPTSDIITIKGLNSLSDVSYIHLLDNKGALVKKVSINESQIDLSSFYTGIYFIEIKHRDGEGTFTKNFTHFINGNIKARFIKIKALNYGLCPSWHLGALF